MSTQGQIAANWSLDSPLVLRLPNVLTEDNSYEFPNIFIVTGAKPEMMMMYAGSKTNLVHAAELTKVDTKIIKILQQFNELVTECSYLKRVVAAW